MKRNLLVRGILRHYNYKTGRIDDLINFLKVKWEGGGQGKERAFVVPTLVATFAKVKFLVIF